MNPEELFYLCHAVVNKKNSLNLFPLEKHYCSQGLQLIYTPFLTMSPQGAKCPPLMSPVSKRTKQHFHREARMCCMERRQDCLWKDVAKYNLPSLLPFVSATSFTLLRSQLQPSHNQIDSWQSVMFPHFTLRAGSLGTSNVKCTIQTPLNI